MPDLIIFDCDGVLVDSEIIAARVDADLLTAAGYPIGAEEFIVRFAGLTFKDALLRIEKETSLPLQASLIDQSRDILDRRLAAEVEAIEGARAAVLATPEPRCVCSNSSPRRLEAMLGRVGILPLFEDGIFSAVAVGEKRPKPAPDVFLHAAAAMGARPEHTFVVEDSRHGVHGARKAGMRVIGFTGGAHSWPGHADELTEAGAETVIRRWADFRPVIEALSDWSE